MSDDSTSERGLPQEPRRRDRRAAASSGGFRRGLRSLPVLLASVAFEVIGEIVFAALIALISFLVYGEIRWLFVATVWLAVNAVLLLLALIVWVRRRSRR